MFRQILIITIFNELGVQHLHYGIFQKLKERFPNSRLTLVNKRHYATSLYDYCAAIDELFEIPLDCPEDQIANLPWHGELKKQHFDIVLNLSDSWHYDGMLQVLQGLRFDSFKSLGNDHEFFLKYPSIKEACFYDPTDPLGKAFQFLHRSRDQGFVIAGEYTYVANLLLGIDETERSYFEPPEEARRIARQTIDFGDNKKIVAINPHSRNWFRALPAQALLDFMEQNRASYNFVIVGSFGSSGWKKNPGMCRYFSWEYYSFLKKIEPLPYVKNCINDNFLLSYCIPLCADYFLASSSGLSTMLYNHISTPTLILAPLIGDYSSGRTAFTNHIFVNLDLEWGLSAEVIQRHFLDLVDNRYGQAAKEPYTTIREGLSYEQYVKKLLWFKLCRLLFTYRPASYFKAKLSWAGPPFEQPLNPNIDWRGVLDIFDILWDMEAEVFRYDINASLLYSFILLNIKALEKKNLSKAETVLTKALDIFLVNPALENNLAICQGCLGKKEQALATLERTYAEFLMPVLLSNIHLIRNHKIDECHLYAMKPMLDDTSGINPDLHYPEMDRMKPRSVRLSPVSVQAQIRTLLRSEFPGRNIAQ